MSFYAVYPVLTASDVGAAAVGYSREQDAGTASTAQLAECKVSVFGLGEVDCATYGLLVAASLVVLLLALLKALLKAPLGAPL